MKKTFLLLAALCGWTAALHAGNEPAEPAEPAWALYPVLNQTSNVTNADNAIDKMYRERKKLDAEALATGKTPLLTDADIRFYDAGTDCFLLNPGVREKKNKEWKIPTNGLWFVLTLNGKKQFAGAFWISFSSLSCPEPVINVMRSWLWLGFEPGYVCKMPHNKKDVYASDAAHAALKKAGKLLGDPLSCYAARIFFRMMDNHAWWLDSNMLSDDFDPKTGRLTRINYEHKDDRFSLFFSDGPSPIRFKLSTNSEVLQLEPSGVPLLPSGQKVHLMIVYNRTSPRCRAFFEKFAADEKKTPAPSVRPE